mmetsp:Transcript_25010/g.57609  ORF Transcript_25010/g.57609 Transcript_25010/m.57609 type:complete len:271 (-) Transcript_25010:1563-2375(-)
MGLRITTWSSVTSGSEGWLRSSDREGCRACVGVPGPVGVPLPEPEGLPPAVGVPPPLRSLSAVGSTDGDTRGHEATLGPPLMVGELEDPLMAGERVPGDDGTRSTGDPGATRLLAELSSWIPSNGDSLSIMERPRATVRGETLSDGSQAGLPGGTGDDVPLRSAALVSAMSSGSVMPTPECCDRGDEEPGLDPPPPAKAPAKTAVCRAAQRGEDDGAGLGAAENTDPERERLWCGLALPPATTEPLRERKPPPGVLGGVAWGDRPLEVGV